MRKFEELTKDIELIYEHGIYFKDIDNDVYGVLAEDTNFLIRDFENQSNKKEVLKQIEENIELLKTF